MRLVEACNVFVCALSFLVLLPRLPLPAGLLHCSLQRNFSMSVNSSAVLRLMGKGGGAAPVGVARGRGSVRGGRGESEHRDIINDNYCNSVNP